MSELKKVQIDGYTIAYRKFGDKGAPLLLIAGLTADMSVWEPMIPELSKNHQVLIFDNLGVGYSQYPDVQVSLDEMASISNKLAESVFATPYHVVGHSMGGAIAQIVAKNHPSLLSLTIVCSFSKLSPLFTLVCKQKEKMYDQGLPPQFIDELALPWAFAPEYLEKEGVLEGIYKFQEENPCPQSKAGYKMQLNALLGFESIKWLVKIQAPTLIIGGEKDLIAPKEDSIQLTEGIPNARLELLPNIGHVPQFENPERLANLMSNFLSQA